MSDITTYKFAKENLSEIKNYIYGENWPVVYIAENGKEAYVGETINVYNRSKQHYENPDRRRLSMIHFFSDEEFNKSAALDIESWLIQYMSADGKFLLQNGNSGLRNHNYYDREKYKAKFEMAWKDLISEGLVNSTLEDLKNSDLFKYSPYKSLTEDQSQVAHQMVVDLKANKHNTFIVSGKPGTGKTILAIYLIKYLKDGNETNKLNVALVVPMTSLRKTIKKVFKNIKGLKSSMVISPNEVVKKRYDLLIVDEAHRLHRRKNIVNYKAFDDVNKKLGLANHGTELDWIIKCSDNQIFFYDPNQTIKPSDIRPHAFKILKARNYELVSQMRVEGGEEYVKFVERAFDQKGTRSKDFSNYDFKLYDNINEMVEDIKEKDEVYGLSRIVAGYAWPWHTKIGKNGKQKNSYDIEISGLKLVWNSTAQDWVNSPNAINEVGCIHTVQGYDLNYVGVIIGPELSYDEDKKKLIIDKDKYFDINGRAGVSDPAELERYIINIYKTLCTRGIKGTFVYIVDNKLKKYFKSNLEKN